MKRFAMNRWILSAFPVLLALSAGAQTKGTTPQGRATPTPTPSKSAPGPRAAPSPAKAQTPPPKTTTRPARPTGSPAKTAPKATPAGAIKPAPTPANEASLDPKKAAAEAQAALLKADVDWAMVAAEGKDMARILSFWAEDAVVFPPGQNAVTGKGAARKYMTGRYKTPWFSIGWKPEQAVVSASADLGYTTGTSEVATPDPNGKVTVLRARYLATWRRAEGGPWQCTTQVWNEGPSTTPAKKK